MQEGGPLKTLQVNLYKDTFLIKYIVPFIVFDSPGDVVFCSEHMGFKGDLLTFKQSRSGYNVSSKEGLEQILLQMSEDGQLAYWWPFFKKREYETVGEMFRVFSYYRLVGGFPPDERGEDEFVVDLLLLPRAERIEHAMSKDPARLLNTIVKVMYSFLIPEAYKSYKPKYRDKLRTLSSAFSPYRKEFLKFEIDTENIEDSMFQLLLLFS
jgi:hypothetical protein